MSALDKFYEAVFKALDVSAIHSAGVPSGNIRPDTDASELLPGGMIVYGWQGASHDRKQRRSRGTFVLTVGSIKNKRDADVIMDLVRDAATAKLLTATNVGVIVHLFKEGTEGLNDGGTTDTGRFLAATSFNVLLIEG